MLQRLLAVVFLSVLLPITVNAQCTPGTSTIPGITPDSATGLAPGIEGQPYNQVMQIRVPQDTTLELIPGTPVTLSIVSIQLISFNGLPPGLTYNCTPSNCTFPGASNGCVEISGIPTAAGIYNPVAVVTTTATFFGQPILQTDTINYYTIVISPATGLAEYNTAGFSLSQNSPNPFSEVTSIDILTPFSNEVEFRIFNMLGKEVHNRQFMTEAGINTLKLDSRDFAPGVYMYSVTMGGKTLTQRMVITKK